MAGKSLLFSLINISTRISLEENKLAEDIQNQFFDKEYTHQIFSFFTELPIETI